MAPPSKYTPEQINDARSLYSEGAALSAIKARTGMPPATLAYYLDGAPTKAGLTYPPIPRRRATQVVQRSRTVRPSRPALVARLWSTAERQVAEIETRLMAAGGDATALERDARTLAILAKTVRDLVALDTATKPKADSDDDATAPPRDIEAFRRSLAQKLEELGALEADA